MYTEFNFINQNNDDKICNFSDQWSKIANSYTRITHDLDEFFIFLNLLKMQYIFMN